MSETAAAAAAAAAEAAAAAAAAAGDILEMQLSSCVTGEED